MIGRIMGTLELAPIAIADELPHAERIVAKDVPKFDHRRTPRRCTRRSVVRTSAREITATVAP
jgi:hypothetical protein